MASEDANFLKHHGFDYKAIEHAVKRNREHPKKRKLGASTISQQTAKNVFLWPGRSWVRKGFEVYFTTLIELMWTKQRIMEVYLNSIEMGEGIYGADAVAEEHFNTDAVNLSKAQCALIAATLPNPRVFSSKRPSAYMLKRQSRILREMSFVPAFPQ
jgi:monofunctional biosynthetic peptidoglycan transglycosylase